MVKRLPVWFFMSVSLVLTGAALLPLLRFALGLEAEPPLAFFTTVTLLLGGLMSGLTAMILLVRKHAELDWTRTRSETPIQSRRTMVLMHASGLLLFTGIPLLNFLVAYWLWIKHRHTSPALDQTGRQVLDFQITVYLYLLLSLFMVFAAIGLITTVLLLAFHLICTVLAICFSLNSRPFNYPANIPVIRGRPAADPDGS